MGSKADQWYCDSKTTACKSISHHCSNCNSVITSSNCLQKHKATCRKQIICTKGCKKTLTVGQFYPTKEARLEQHVCGRKWCFRCRREVEEGHCCPLEFKIKSGSTLPKVGSLVLSKTCPRFWVRDKCYFLNKELDFPHGTQKCDIHAEIEDDNEDDTVTYGVIYRETETHEKFISSTYSCNSDIIPCNALPDHNDWYLPDKYQNSKATCSKITTERYGRAPAHFSRDILVQSKGNEALSVEEQIIVDVQNDLSFANTVIFTKAENIGLLVRAIQKLGHSTNIKLKMKGHQFSYLQTGQNNVKFMAIENYLTGSTHTLAKSYGLSPAPNCFPRAFCQITNLQYSGAVPHYHYWTMPTDSLDKKEEIRAYVEQLSGEWILAKALSEHVEKKCLLLTQVLVHFLRQCFKIQEMLQRFLKKDNVPFVHPFKSPIVSISSFAYKLLTDYTLSEHNLMTTEFTETGIYDHNCSIPEWYLSKKVQKDKPGNKLWGAYLKNTGSFRGFGRIATPDVYDETEAKCYWMNGCR